MLSAEEIRAVRYYIGDVDGNSPFWSDPKAYVVLNSLFFDGIASERARASEGKYLNPEILSDVHRLADLLDSLLSVFGKTTAECETHTYRVERFSDYSEMKKQGRTVSFTSTSLAGFLNEYRDRSGIALMEFVIPKGTACIPMSAVLRDYAKDYEAEVLLPPFMKLDIKEHPVGLRHNTITDRDGNPPITECSVICGSYYCNGFNEKADSRGAEAGKRVYAALNNGKLPSDEDIELYIAWKREFILKQGRIIND